VVLCGGMKENNSLYPSHNENADMSSNIWGKIRTQLRKSPGPSLRFSLNKESKMVPNY